MRRITGENYKRLLSYIKRNGVKASVFKVIERLSRDDSEKTYSQDVFDLICDKEEEEFERSVNFKNRYKFSIIVPAYETGARRIKEMIFSVLSQTYDNFELCIADASNTDEVENAVKSMNSDKIKYVRLKENKGISENTNEALKLATGEYVVFLDHDDILTKNALFEVMNVFETAPVNQIKLVYSDEDKCNDECDTFFDHHIKPDFDIDLLRSNNYICHMLTVSRELALSVGGFDKDYDGAQDHDFILRCVEKLNRNEIKHIGKVLYHWRSHTSSTATNPDSKLYAYEAGKRAVKAHLERLHIDAEVSDTMHLGFYRVKYKVSAHDLTDVKIMSLDELKALSIDELKESDFKYAMIINDNVRLTNADGIEEMLGINKGKIESAGYSVNEEGELTPDFSGLNKNFSGYLHRAKLTREVAGVCTDCMMVKKSAINADKTFNKDMIVVYCPYSIFKRV